MIKDKLEQKVRAKMGITREEVSLNRPLVEGMLIMKDPSAQRGVVNDKVCPYTHLPIVERKETHANVPH